MIKNKAFFYLFVIGLLFPFLASAGTVELHGTMTMANNGNHPATVVLKCYADESFSMATPISKDGTFSFSVDVKGNAGLYSMRFARSSYDVVLPAAEKVVNVSIKMDKDVMTDISIDHSPENDAYKAFRSVQNPFDVRLRDWYVNCEKKDSCEKALHEMLEVFASQLKEVQDNYKGTYTADVICKLRTPVIAKDVKNTSVEFSKGYFDNVPFGDSTIFNIPVYKEMVADYVDFLSGYSLAQESEFIKTYTGRIKANPVVLRKSAGLLFDEIIKHQKEKMLVMFVEWYNTGNNKVEINNPVLDLRLKNISAVMPGQAFIDISAPDTAGVNKELKNVVTKSKCTLLIFWSSECSHCRDEMPFIQEYYKKYHSKGFDVYAVTIEPDHDKWKKFINEKGLPWTNVSISQQTTPNPAMQYVITSTPGLVLINNKGVILHRFFSKSRLEEFIKETLK